MLGIVSMAGNALKALGGLHPAVKWGVIVLAGLLAVEFVGREAIEIYARMATVKGEVAAKNAQNAGITEAPIAPLPDGSQSKYKPNF